MLTNNHVVGSARADVRVGSADKRELAPRSSAPTKLTDLAVLKIDATNLPVLGWGDSSKLRVAEWVLAIGNPFQLNQTVTLGIVSATNRRLEGRVAGYEDFIQTDAAINPGNSGGALINARGELVGINTAIYSESGGYQGIGFAVPSNLARHVMDDIIRHGGVRRGTIRGIQLQPMTPQIAERARRARRPRRADPRDRAVLGRLRGRPRRRHHRRLQRHADRGRVAIHPPARRRRDRQHGDAHRLPRRPAADRANQDRTGDGTNEGYSINSATCAPEESTRARRGSPELVAEIPATSAAVLNSQGVRSHSVKRVEPANSPALTEVSRTFTGVGSLGGGGWEHVVESPA